MSSELLHQQQTLKQALRNKRSQLSEVHATRLHRALSWLKCAAEQEDNLDLRLISLWISFNACFAVDEGSSETLAERNAFQKFVEKLVEHDTDKKIYACLWETYSGPVKSLIKNPYVYHGFWVSKRQDKNDEHWRKLFDASSVMALNSLSRQIVPDLLSIVLDRLFVLRNQLLHGGATYASSVNRDQVSDGSQLLGALIPILIEIMLEANDEDWGEIYYPLIDQP